MAFALQLLMQLPLRQVGKRVEVRLGLRVGKKGQGSTASSGLPCPSPSCSWVW